MSRNGTVLANYSYLADGTKLSATDADGNGLVYAGSLVYRKQNGVLALESAPFSGGRFVATKGSNGTIYTPLYYLTDHLGSIRAVVDGATGQVIETNDYYPFGMRWQDPNQPVSDNRYRYNAKEEQNFLNLPYTDYGARMRDPKYGIGWNRLDPLTEITPDISPSVFCANTPINAVDTDGRLVIFIGGFELGRAAKATVINASISVAVGNRLSPYDVMNMQNRATKVDRNFSKTDEYDWGKIDNLYKDTFNDQNALYTQGRTNDFSAASERYDLGQEAGKKLALQIAGGYVSLADGETIKLVGHSQGAAYAAGMAQALIDAGYSDRIETVDYIAPHQPGSFSHPQGVLGRQFGSDKDQLSGRGTKINNIDELNHHIGSFGKGAAGGHSIINQDLYRLVQAYIASGGVVTYYE